MSVHRERSRDPGDRRPHVLAARLDSVGDVLLQGPAIRALTASARRVTVLAGPRGAPAAQLLPGVDEVLTFRAPWIDPEPEPVDAAQVAALVRRVRALAPDVAVVFTSFHQSPLPLALLLRLAGVPRVGAISEDYPGTLLDVRHRVPDGMHEVERALSLAEAMGFSPPPGDDLRLRLRTGARRPPALRDRDGYVVLHVGASAPARAWPGWRFAELAALLSGRGEEVVVTGAYAEVEVAHRVAGDLPGVVDLAGRTDLGELAAVLAGGRAVVCANTGPAHLAAAVGTPIVSLFAPVVPSARWRPWSVPHVLLGDQRAACAGTRARDCPVPGHPCLSGVTALDVAAALERLADRHSEQASVPEMTG
ncbi:MAG: glycosyltransferase family 9 protein [Candidatus Dormibacteraeota bacterium]|nr:glycosyltransferase family 9 protein [Candidatus Dormibacteraeota bacterium]MBO0761539.1 glycosyltransferase family 9 protein [Candidatus Dormibacteraeota bacterium]